MSNSPTTAQLLTQQLPSTAVASVQPVKVGSQAVTTAAQSPVAIARIADDQWQFKWSGQSFLSTASDALGNLGDPTDGWDELFAIPISQIDQDSLDVVGMLFDIADADFIEGAFEADTFSPIGSALATFTSTGDTIFNAFNATVAPIEPGDPSQPPGGGGGSGGGAGGGGGGNPGGGGGSGGGGGIGSGPGLRCTLVVDPKTGQVTGTECSPTPSPGGGVHSPLQP